MNEEVSRNRGGLCGIVVKEREGYYATLARNDVEGLRSMRGCWGARTTSDGAGSRTWCPRRWARRAGTTAATFIGAEYDVSERALEGKWKG